MLGKSWVFVCGLLVAAELENKLSTVDFALETALGFNSTDNTDNIKFLDKVQRVISNIKSVFERKSNKGRAINSEKIEKFTDFIQTFIKKLKKYDDADLKYFVTVFNDEVRKYHYRGCKFNELIDNYGLRKYLSGMLNEVQVQPGETIRDKLQVFADKLEKVIYNRFERNLIEVINSIYKKDSIDKFQDFLIEIDAYRLKTAKKDLDLVKVIREGLRLIIFDHYSLLNQHVRKVLKSQVNEFWNYLSQNKPFVLDTVKSFRVKKIESTVKISNNVLTIKDINTETNQGLHPSSPTAAVKQDKMKFNKVRNDGLIGENLPIKPDGKFINNKKNKPNYRGRRTRSKIFTTRHSQLEKKRLTFRTLYPDFVPEWTIAQSLVLGRQFARGSPVRRGGVKVKNFDEELDTTFKVGSGGSHMPRKTTKFEKFENKVPIKISGFNIRKSNRRVMFHKATRRKLTHPKKVLGRHDIKHIFNRHLVDLSSDSVNNYRSSNKRDSTISEEGISIESLGIQPILPHRRSDTVFNITVKRTVTELNSILQIQTTPGVPEVDNDTIYNSKINVEIKNATSFDRAKLGGTNKNVDSTEKVKKRYENKLKLDNSTENRSTFERNKPIKNVSITTQDDSKNKESHIDSKNNKDDTQTTHDENLFNYRAMLSSNETVTEFTKDKEDNPKNDVIILRKSSNVIDLNKDFDEAPAENNNLSKNQDRKQSEKSTDKQNLETDFKTFISDYENDFKQYKKLQITTKIDEVLSSMRTENNTKAEKIAPVTTFLTTRSTTSVTEEAIVRTSTDVFTGSHNAITNTTSSLDINQNRYLQEATNVQTAFDARFIKELMKTTKATTERTTTRESKAMGRYFNENGVFVDSMEEVKQELYDTALNNVEYNYEKGKDSDYKNDN